MFVLALLLLLLRLGSAADVQILFPLAEVDPHQLGARPEPPAVPNRQVTLSTRAFQLSSSSTTAAASGRSTRATTSTSSSSRAVTSAASAGSSATSSASTAATSSSSSVVASSSSASTSRTSRSSTASTSAHATTTSATSTTGGKMALTALSPSATPPFIYVAALTSREVLRPSFWVEFVASHWRLMMGSLSLHHATVPTASPVFVIPAGPAGHTRYPHPDISDLHERLVLQAAGGLNKATPLVPIGSTASYETTSGTMADGTLCNLVCLSSISGTSPANQYSFILPNHTSGMYEVWVSAGLPASVASAPKPEPVAQIPINGERSLYFSARILLLYAAFACRHSIRYLRFEGTSNYTKSAVIYFNWNSASGVAPSHIWWELDSDKIARVYLWSSAASSSGVADKNVLLHARPFRYISPALSEFQLHYELLKWLTNLSITGGVTRVFDKKGSF